MKKIGFLFIIMALSAGLSSVSAQIDWEKHMNMGNGYTGTEAENYTADAGEYLDLAIQHPKLTEIPAYVFEMTNLRELDLSGNRIGVISEDILKLTKLEILRLGGNQYLKELPDFLMEMESLKTIHFEGMGTWSTAKKEEAKRRFAEKGIEVILK